MIKTFIDKLAETEGEVKVRLCTEEGFYEVDLDDETDRYEELMRAFIEVGFVPDMEVLIIKTEDDGTKRVCTAGLYIDAQSIALIDKAITERALNAIVAQIKEARKNAGDDEEEYDYEDEIDYEEIIPDDFENMFGKFKDRKFIIQIDDDENCDAVKVVIEKVSNINKETNICEIGGVGYTFFADADKDEKLDALYDLFFTDGRLTDGADIYIEINDEGKRRICTITVTRDELIIHGTSFVKKLIYGDDVKEGDIDENVSIEDFESIFGKVDEKFVTRISDISFNFNIN